MSCRCLDRWRRSRIQVGNLVVGQAKIVERERRQVRFIGGGLAPYAAGKLVDHYNVHVPFLLGAVTVALGAVLLATVHRQLAGADTGHPA